MPRSINVIFRRDIVVVPDIRLVDGARQQVLILENEYGENGQQEAQN